MSYNEWKEAIIHLKDKVILPDNRTVLKAGFIRPAGFDHVKFDNFLKDLYKAKYNTDDR